MFPAFLSSGLFLGWSLGANDASNVFGTAVSSRMITFRAAATWCSIFVILGAVVSGTGASHTLGKLGAVNAIAGAFIVAFAAAMSVYLMTLARYPVSTSQAIVGAIVGWNMFSGSLTDYASLSKIVSTWVVCPILSAVISIIFYRIVVMCINKSKPHMFLLDKLTRYGLLLAGIFGSYSLGANNIANVMGVFVPVSPFSDITIFGVYTMTAAQQLFLIGGVAIAVGVFTYSKRVMLTVGGGIFDLTPVASFVVVWAHSIVLFVFSSQSLGNLLQSIGLPPIPLVPVSSSQAIVGAVIGIGLLKGGRVIRWRTVGGIASSWITTPVIAGLMSFISLFFLQNVFMQQAYKPVQYALTPAALERLAETLDTTPIKHLAGATYPNAKQFKETLDENLQLDAKALQIIMEATKLEEMKVTSKLLSAIRESPGFSLRETSLLKKLSGKDFKHRWQLADALNKSGQDPKVSIIYQLFKNS